MPFTEDASAFFDTDEFATAAYFDGSITAINVIFDSEYRDFDEQVASTNPECECALADVTSVKNAIDKDLIIGTTTYKIRNARPDINAFTVVLELEQQGNL